MNQPKTLYGLLEILDEKKVNYTAILKWSEVHNILEILSKYDIFKSIRLAFKGDGIHGPMTIDSISAFELCFPKPEIESPWMCILDINTKEVDFYDKSEI